MLKNGIEEYELLQDSYQVKETQEEEGGHVNEGEEAEGKVSLVSTLPSLQTPVQKSVERASMLAFQRTKDAGRHDFIKIKSQNV